MCFYIQATSNVLSDHQNKDYVGTEKWGLGSGSTNPISFQQIPREKIILEKEAGPPSADAGQLPSTQLMTVLFCGSANTSTFNKHLLRRKDLSLLPLVLCRVRNKGQGAWIEGNYSSPFHFQKCSKTPLIH